MKKTVLLFLCFSLLTTILSSQSLRERINNISKREMQSVMEFLGHDLLEGRAPGTRGGNLGEIYMQSLYKFLDFKPGVNGKYLQPFKLIGFTTQHLNIKTNNISLKYLDEAVGTYIGPENKFDMEGELVFIGFGITTDLWKWDDYKNTIVKNKIVIVRVNDPGMYKSNIFEGSTLTYFGRWKYKIEEAIRRGAAGILLIHTDESAGYNWEVVKNSWSGEELYLEKDIQHNLKFSGWIKESSLIKILATKKINLKKLYQKSLGKTFKPVNLGLKIRISGQYNKRELINHNVVAKIPGKSTNQIILSAHIDHLGKNPSLKGDSIFNGAIDNGSAVAAMMVTAKILKEFQHQLHYTITLLACNAEESGLLGSKYFVQQADKKTIITNINFESTPVWEKSKDFMAIGARFSTLEDMLKKILVDEGLTYTYFSMANQGFFYRSDQFSFARYNIPAIWISAGENDISGQKKYPAFWKTNYHTVKDEYNPQWKLEGMKQTIQIACLLIDYMNKTRKKPQWKRNLTFPLEKN